MSASLDSQAIHVSISRYKLFRSLKKANIVSVPFKKCDVKMPTSSSIEINILLRSSHLVLSGKLGEQQLDGSMFEGNDKILDLIVKLEKSIYKSGLMYFVPDARTCSFEVTPQYRDFCELAELI